MQAWISRGERNCARPHHVPLGKIISPVSDFRTLDQYRPSDCTRYVCRYIDSLILGLSNHGYGVEKTDGLIIGVRVITHLSLIILVHWSSPVRKSVFSQYGGPVRRSSPVRKLASTFCTRVVRALLHTRVFVKFKSSRLYRMCCKCIQH